MTLIAGDGTHYEKSGGNGPAVILIHGLGLNRAMWQWQTKAIGKHYRVIAYDLYGHGESPPPPARPSLSLLSEQLLRLMDQLQIEKAAIVGFSLGGMIARRFAMDRPERLWALAILSSAHRRDPEAQRAIQLRVDQARRDGPQATVEAALDRWFTEAFRLANPDIMDLVRKWVLANDKAIYPDFYQVLVDGIDELVAPKPPIACPTLVMTGDEDYGNSPEMARAIAAEIPVAMVIILRGLRHLGMIEAGDLHAANLISFLRGVR